MLDCDTPLGQVYMNEQYKTQILLEDRGYTIINTPGKDHTSDILLAKEIDSKLTLYGLAEIKSRKMAGDQIIDRAYVEKNGYLVTNEKLRYGAVASSFYKVPFFLIVNLLLDKRVLVWQITNHVGEFTMEYKILETKTQKTCNGGDIIRRNAYLPLNNQFVTEITYE